MARTAAAGLQTTLEGAEGAADTMRKKMAAGLPGAVAEFKSVIEGLMLALGDGGLKGDSGARAADGDEVGAAS